MEQDQEQEAAQARANASVMGSNVATARSILRRPSTPGVPVQHYSVVDCDGRDIDEFLEEGELRACSMAVDSESDKWTTTMASASQVRSKAKARASNLAKQPRVVKPADWGAIRRNKAELLKKAEAEARLARPKGRTSAYTPDEGPEPDDMSVDDVIEVVPRPELAQKDNVAQSLKEFERMSPETSAEPQYTAKATVRQPKKSKGYKDLITRLGSEHPAEAVRERLLADLALYQKLFEVTDAARAALKSIVEGKPIVEEAVVNIQSLSLEGFVTRGWIVATPKLPVNIKGPTEAATELAMLDTGAEANVMTYELAKKLGCPILSTENLKLKTVSGQVLQFTGMAKAEVEIEHGIRYTTVFFLVRESRGQTLPMVLLGQPFTRAMKMTFEHGDYGSMDAVFHDPHSHSTCTVPVVPPVKRSVRTNYQQQAFVEDGSSGEEN